MATVTTLVAGATLALSLGSPCAARADDDVPPVTVRLHMKDASGLALETAGPGAATWTKVCDAPCDREVVLDSTYRVVGPEMAPSSDLHLRGHAGERLVLDVNRTTPKQHRTGKALVIGGAIVLGIGGALSAGYGIASLADNNSTAGCDVAGSTSCHTSPPAALLWTGVALGAVGLGGLISGLIVMSPTSVQQEPPAAERPQSADLGATPFLVPRFTSTPLVSGTF